MRVALLGGGESVANLNLEIQMPIIGINDSWQFFPTPLRVFVDYKIQRPTVKPHETVFFPAPYPGYENEAVNMISFPHLPKHFTGIDFPFLGFELDKGTFAPFAGFFAMEVAVWLGFTEIHLLGFDCAGAHHHDKNKRPSEKQFETWEYLINNAAEFLKAKGIDVIRHK